ncbi:O-acetylhomoserine aminocarboxypropyltransferase/cysteine synthase family protein [Salinirubellus sp. GCM10025818]|uniref:O-acetylhomoserine aminocarboxypropyltransferase/cysteine synthase family protein n=1 Tax=Salinirubellus TaxID=2162630 RepID=UPI0030CDC90F
MNDDGKRWPSRGFGTRCVHAGRERDPGTGAAATPIHQTTSYEFEDADTAAGLYALDELDHVYSRISNPTVRVLERRLAALHGAPDALATNSGMGAFDAATTVLTESGDNVVSASSIYGGTHSYLSKTANRRGIEARFVDTLDPDAYEEAIDEDTAYVHCETLANPSLVTPPLAEIADVAHDHGVPLLVDNTFATPALCRPFEHGVDLVWESTTKWIHGSGTTVGGVLLESGAFPWTDYPEKYPEVGGPNPAFHGVNFAERFGERAFTLAARHRAARVLGDGQSPFDAWATMQGTETLHLRMERHCENAHAVAEFLADHPDVAWVTYPGLADHETHDAASEYLDRFGGMVAFGLEGGYEACKRLCEAVDLASFLANIGDARTLIIHPASTTHAQLDEAEQRASGVSPDLLRLSVGIEDVDDVIADLDSAIERVTGETREGA